MIKINSTEEFENIIANIEGRCKNIEAIFENQDNNMERINHTEVWTGETQEVIYNKYQELKENYNQILESLQIYISFMRQTVNDYKELENKIGTDADSNSSQLDVNS